MTEQGSEMQWEIRYYLDYTVEDSTYFPLEIEAERAFWVAWDEAHMREAADLNCGFDS